jgi:hypothetical protein
MPCMNYTLGYLPQESKRGGSDSAPRGCKQLIWPLHPGYIRQADCTRPGMRADDWTDL